MSDGSDGSRGDEQQAPDQQIAQLLAEAHMILPGLLTLLGLQIMSVFNPVFQDELEPGDHVLHFVALCLLACGAALVVTPAAYHRQVSPHEIPKNFAALASGFVTAAMVPLMLAITIDIYLVSRLALDAGPLCAVVTSLLLAVFAGLWFVFPQVMVRLRRRRRAREA